MRRVTKPLTRRLVLVGLYGLALLPATAWAQSPTDVVLYASGAPVRQGNWNVVADGTAAGGARLANPDLGAPKLNTPLANPAHYFELTFTALANTNYRLWIRGKAQNDSYDNDSVYVQFDRSVTTGGAATTRIGTTSAHSIVLEDCYGEGVQGWGWQDNGWCGMGTHIRFQPGGAQRIRVQVREDGLSIDQVVLSPTTYLNTSPGALKNDNTILPLPGVLSMLTSPAPGASNVFIPVNFQWTSVAGVQAYYLYVGSAVGLKDYVDSGETLQTSLLSYDVPWGRLVYARMWTKSAGLWQSTDSTFTTAAYPASTLTYPTAGATNVSLPIQFQWTSVPSVQAYYLYVGTSSGSLNLVNTGEILQTSYLVSSLPSGQTLYARIWTKVGGVWRWTENTFTVASSGFTSLKVLSWNVQFVEGTDGLYNPTRTASWIAFINADLVALCEIEDWQTANLINLVQQMTGRTWYTFFVPKYPGGAEGNLVLSKFPLLSTSFRYLSYWRSVARVAVNVGGRNINFFATHLDHTSSEYRAVQIQELTAWAAGFPEQRIIAGDINAGPDTWEVSFFTPTYIDTWIEAMDDGTAAGYPDNPVWMHTRTRRGRIDHIYYSRNASFLSVANAYIPDSRDLSNPNVVVVLGTLDDLGVRPSDHNHMVTVFEVR